MTVPSLIGLLFLWAGGVFRVWSMLVGLDILHDVDAVLPADRKNSFFTSWRTREFYRLHRLHYPSSGKVSRLRLLHFLTVLAIVLAWLFLAVVR